MNNVVRINIVMLMILFCVSVFHSSAHALSCGKFNYPKCSGPDLQYSGGFDPQVGFGGFGGGICSAQRAPVVFIHGNGDRAINWDSPVTGSVKNFSPPARSVYQEFKARGYNDCELFGITYLSVKEQQNPKTNYHKPAKYDVLIAFIEAVKSYTGKKKVDIVAHSLGVSMTLAALTYHDSQNSGKNGWSGVRRFVNIAGGIRGLPACLNAGFFNPFISTCGSQNIFNEYVFGFYPDTGYFIGFNKWMAAKGPLSLRGMPSRHPQVLFYTLSAGAQDQVHCSTTERSTGCDKGALFVKAANVKAQLNVGAGSRPQKVNFDFQQWRPRVAAGGDADGVGHFKARNNTGQILFEMLNSDCTGLACKGSYTGGPVVEDE